MVPPSVGLFLRVVPTIPVVLAMTSVHPGLDFRPPECEILVRFLRKSGGFHECRLRGQGRPRLADVYYLVPLPPSPPGLLES